MPDTVVRFTISIPPDLLGTFDAVCAAKGYVSRSEAVRDALRDYLIAHEWRAEDASHDVVGTITLVCDLSHQRLPEELALRLQQVHPRVLSTTRVYLDTENCLEVVVVRGTGREVAALADSLISLRGVKHGRLVCTTTGTALS